MWGTGDFQNSSIAPLSHVDTRCRRESGKKEWSLSIFSKRKRTRVCCELDRASRISSTMRSDRKDAKLSFTSLNTTSFRRGGGEDWIKRCCGITCVCVCVEESWLKRPHLPRITLIRLWGWARPHTCCVFEQSMCNRLNQPSPHTHTQGDLQHGNIERKATLTHHYVQIYHKPLSYTATLGPYLFMVYLKGTDRVYIDKLRTALQVS